MDAGGTRLWMVEGRTMQELLSRVTQEMLPSARRGNLYGMAPLLEDCHVVALGSGSLLRPNTYVHAGVLQGSSVYITDGCNLWKICT